jgi:hypothetical protein
MMRRRITRALVTTAAAGATIATIGFTAAGSAGATVAHPATTHESSSLPLISTHSFGGFEASGRDFRYVTALIRVPDMSENGLYPQTYIQLSNGSLATGDTETQVGIETCTVAEAVGAPFVCPAGVEWVGYIEAFNNSINFPFFTHFVPLDVQQGDGVDFSIYFDQAGNELHFVLTPPTAESCSTGPNNECFFKTNAHGPVYDHAAGLADYTNSSGTPVPLPIFGTHFRLTQFLQGALTTYSGVRGSWTGPWTTSEVEATSNGLPFPQGTVRLSPGPLWSDGVSVNGAVRANDAFGIWRRVG